MHIDWVTASDDDRVAFAAELLASWEREAFPDERATPVAEVAQSVWSHPIGVSGQIAVAESNSQVVGAAYLLLDVANPSTAWVRWLVVDPAHRREGIGRALVGASRDAARAEGFTQLGHAALSDSHVANDFAVAVGARPGLVSEENRLAIADIPPGLIDEWIDRAAERAGGYSLVSWNNECPDEYLERCARAYEIMNTAPDQVGEPLSIDPERVRAGLAVHAGRGEGFHTTVLDERSQDLVALTELRHNRFRPWNAGQGDTCTHPAHRDKGLGRWIKAYNLRWLLGEHPEVEYVDTWNAGVNEPMLSINRALGFTCRRTWRHWRF
jgi:GNAT superfamily N-acetyltransferase